MSHDLNCDEQFSTSMRPPYLHWSCAAVLVSSCYIFAYYHESELPFVQASVSSQTSHHPPHIGRSSSSSSSSSISSRLPLSTVAGRRLGAQQPSLRGATPHQPTDPRPPSPERQSRPHGPWGSAVPVVLPLVAGLAWFVRWLRTPSPAAASYGSCDLPMAALSPVPQQPPREELPPPEVLVHEITRGEYAAHYAQNVSQFLVPVVPVDNIPVISLVDLFRLGAEGIPLSRLQSRSLMDAFTGGFQDITGVPVFVLLHRYVTLHPIYKLCIGPRSVVVISDAVAVKHILKSEMGRYDKGILAEVLKPIMGKGLIPADPLTWLARRRAIKPAFHQKWLDAQMQLYNTIAHRMATAMRADAGAPIDMQELFCSASLDIIGKAVFNYDFGSITRQSPVIQAVYAVMREAERRASSIVPYWLLPNGTVELDKHMKTLDNVLAALVKQCIRQFEKEEIEPKARVENNSLLRFLVEARGQDVTTQQLRDDLMTMLIAGHETTAATLTWALHELSKPEHRDLLDKVRQQVDQVMGPEGTLALEDVKALPLVRYCLVEALRLYPAPPLLIRRCLKEDHLVAAGAAYKSGITIRAGQDVMLATWSMHRDKRLWGETAEEYDPLRFLTPAKGSADYQAAGWEGYDPAKVRGLYPDEFAADFGFVPFGGGSRKCMGDQFAMLESTVLLAHVLHTFELQPAAPVTLGMGATIFAKEGLMMKVRERSPAAPHSPAAAPAEAPAEPPKAHVA